MHIITAPSEVFFLYWSKSKWSCANLIQFAHVHAQQRKRVQTTSPDKVSHTRPQVTHRPRVAVKIS